MRSKLFEPGKIGTLTVENRIVMAPMGGVGQLSQKYIDYYVARARGGTGLIITGGTMVEPGLETLRLTRLDGEEQLHYLRKLAEMVHLYGKKVAVQLVAGVGRNSPLRSSLQPVGASPVPCFENPNVITRELTVQEIESLVAAFGRATEMAKNAGIDAVEVHGYGGYLLDQFQTSLWNKRTDRYGGNLDGRLRFSMEIIDAIRKAGGPDYPIIFKFTPEHRLEGGRTLDEGLEIARRLERAGVAALHIDIGCHDNWYLKSPPVYMEPAPWLDVSRRVKEVVRIPVITGGKLGYPELAEKALREGKGDFVALGRHLLADPDWPNKAKQQRPDDIRPCIGCHVGCWAHLRQGKNTACAVNPATGMEREYALVPAGKRKTVLVVGGGPGGMEAAAVAAERGHEVLLWEKGDRLGGNLLPASTPAFKRDVRLLTDYLSNQVKTLGVKVELGREATAELILRTHPESVIVATGAVAALPDIPGIRSPNAFSAIDLLAGKRKAGNTVIIAGGGIVGCETAVYLASQGKKVTIIKRSPNLLSSEGADLHPINRMMLLKMVAESGVAVITGAPLVGVSDEGAIVEMGGTRELLRADSIVLALGLRSESALAGALDGKVPELFVVGDCVSPRGAVLYAMWEGFHAARNL